MFFRYVLTAEFFLSFFISLLLAMGANLFVKGHWIDIFTREPDKKYQYKTESFRNPINLSVTIASLLIPLVSALIAFLVTNLARQQIESLSTLFAALCILILSVCWGVWLSYSLATLSPTDDSFLIDKTKHWEFPGYFAAQLFLLLTGTLLILLFLLFRFELPAKPGAPETSNWVNVGDRIWMGGAPEREVVFELLRQDLDVGVSQNIILKKWGQPDKVERSVEERITRYVYTSPHSTYIISCRDGVVLSFLVQKTETPGGVK